MRIGLTYDLRSEYLAAGFGDEETAEFDREETIESIEGALRELGHETDRIGHARQLVNRLAAGGDWNLVFNICEGFNGLGREAQVPAILDLFEIPYTFSDPVVMALCLHKGLAKCVVQKAGIPTPPFATIERLSDLESLAIDFPLFLKPVGEGTGKGVTPSSIVTDGPSLWKECEALLHQFNQPVLVEEYLSGREFTVGLAGSGENAEVLGTLEIVLRESAEAGVYSYVNKEYCEEHVDYPLVLPSDPQVQKAEQCAFAAWKALGCRDAGRVDLRCDGFGNPQFLEVNPLAGLHPLHSDLPMVCTAVGIPYVDLIDRIVQSASVRIGPRKWAGLSTREHRSENHSDSAVAGA